MNLLDILKEGNKTLKPEALLVIYHNYIEVASIENEQIGEFSPLTKDALTKLIQLSSSETSVLSVGGLIPKNVLYVSYSISSVKIVFKLSAHKRTILIDNGTVVVNIPNLLMVIKNDRLYVYSYKSYLNDKTILYKAPFSNNTGRTSVCFGTIKIGRSLTLNKIVSNFEDAYWRSQFQMSGKEARELIKNNWNKENRDMNYKKLIQSL